MESNSTNKNNITKILNIIFIIIILILLGYILYTPALDLFKNLFNSDEVLVTEDQELKNKVEINKYKINNKELVLLTNNSDKTLYDINVMGFFYDAENKPISTDSSNYLYFIPAGKTVAIEIYCYDETNQAKDFAECIIDFEFSTESDYTTKYFTPMNDQIEFSDLNVINEAGILVADCEVKNISEHKIARADIIAVFYKNGIPVACTSGDARNIFADNSQDALFMPIPAAEYDEYKIFVESCYSYSYH